MEQMPRLLRDEAIRLAIHACNGFTGRVLGDPVFEEVTEGRAKWPKYSACGDLAHWILWMLRIRANRNDDGDGDPWKVGYNLSAIVYGMPGAFIWNAPGKRPKPGDILYVSHPEHVCILLDISNGVATTADYGQWDPNTDKPCGRLVKRTFDCVSLGKRRLRGWLDIELAKAVHSTPQSA